MTLTSTQKKLLSQYFCCCLDSRHWNIFFPPWLCLELRLKRRKCVQTPSFPLAREKISRKACFRLSEAQRACSRNSPTWPHEHFPSPWFENISEQATTIREFQDETREIWNLSRPTCYFTHRRFCCRLRQAANSSEFHFQHAIAGSPRFWSSVPLPQNQFSFARSRCAALC